jgi:hypothetical protein
VLECIVILQEGLLSIERWVDIAELHLANVFTGKLWKACKAGQRVESITLDQEIIFSAAAVRPGLAVLADFGKQPDLTDSPVARWQPLVAAILVSE